MGKTMIPTSPHWAHSHSHEAVCCDDPHSASASGSTTPAKRRASSELLPHFRIDAIGDKGHEECEECHHPCTAGEVVCCEDAHCDSPTCEGSAVECCEDPTCDVAPPKLTCEDCHQPLVPKGGGGTGMGTEQEETEKALTEWMCSKEGCEAIAQYVKVCTEQNCSLPVVHPEPSWAFPPTAEPPPPTAHFHIAPHTHPHPHAHGHAPSLPNLQTALSMLPPALPPMAVSVQPTPLTSPDLSWPVSTASSASTPQSHFPPAPANQVDNAFSLPPAGWSDVVQATHICHWQNCHLTFPSMPDLLAHVATDHLGAPGFSAPLLDPGQQHMANMNVNANAQLLSQPVTPHTAGVSRSSHTSNASSMDFSELDFNNYGIHGQSTPVVPDFQPNGHMAGMQHGGAQNGMELFGESDGLLSCLWDDCFPLPDECSADPNEACPPHPVQSHHHATPMAPSTVNTSLFQPHAHSHPHDPNGDHSHPQSHGHGHGHAHAHHTAVSGTESFSPQTMLRHVLEEHLGVPSDILGWNELLAAPLPASTADHVKKAHHKLHAKPRRAVFPTPPSSHPTPSPPLVTPGLVCQWPGCPHTEPFTSSAELMDHLSEEHIGRGKDHYICKWGECQHLDGGDGRSFRSRQKVLRHLQSHTGHKPYVCEECGQAFGEAAPLAAHVRRHAQEKPFVCDHPGCGKRFAISSSLTIHMRTHNGEKPFICPHCNKGFVEASNLTKHIRTHTGERPFACTHPGCGKRFPRPDQLKRHMGVHEKEKTLSEGNVKRRKISV